MGGVVAARLPGADTMSGATAVAKKKPGPKPKVSRRDALVTFKCRAEYKAWLAAFARSQRDIPSRLIDVALIDLAKKLGYEAPPER